MGVRVLVGLGLGFMWNAAPVDLLGVFLNLLAFLAPHYSVLEKNPCRMFRFMDFAISCNCKISAAPWVPFTAVLCGWTDSSRLELMLRFAAVGWTKFWCGEAPTG